MAFIQASASYGPRAEGVLSADNAVPERHIVMETLRIAAPRLGLAAPIVATLDAMLSCLPPKRTHHTVFASNATLTFRRNGISDRTIRRHAAALQEAGLLIRRDSPNRKRFMRRNVQEGRALRFGFDLTPLFDRLGEISALAAEVRRETERLSYLRAKIRSAAHELAALDPADSDAAEARRALRRKLTLHDCERLLNRLSAARIAAEGVDNPQETPRETQQMATSDGQNVRHHHKSNKELDDKRETPDVETASPSIAVKEIVAACPEANLFVQGPVRTPEDVIEHGRMLAPMLGIDQGNYRAAEERLGSFRTAMTIWALMQFHGRIGRAGAYFRAITTGARSDGFCPVRLIRRLLMAPPVAA